MDQHLQHRQSLHEDGTPQILLITPSEKKLGHHLTLSIDTILLTNMKQHLKLQKSFI